MQDRQRLKSLAMWRSSIWGRRKMENRKRGGIKFWQNHGDKS